MATTSPTTCLEQIGETAGLVWATLSQNGPLSLAQVVKNVGRPRDLVMQAVGGLPARKKSRLTTKAVNGSSCFGSGGYCLEPPPGPAWSEMSCRRNRPGRAVLDRLLWLDSPADRYNPFGRHDVALVAEQNRCSR